MTKFVPYGMLTFCKNCGEQNPYHRELSDEEILQFQDKVPYTLGSDLIDFARAILKKASEK